MPEDALQPIKLGKPELDAPEYSDVTHVMLTYNWQPLPPQSWIGHHRQAMDAAGYDTGSNRMAMLRGRSLALLRVPTEDLEDIFDLVDRCCSETNRWWVDTHLPDQANRTAAADEAKTARAAALAEVQRQIDEHYQ